MMTIEPTDTTTQTLDRPTHATLSRNDDVVTAMTERKAAITEELAAPVLVLIEALLADRLSADQFATVFMPVFKGSGIWPDQVRFAAVEAVFFAVDDYTEAPGTEGAAELRATAASEAPTIAGHRTTDVSPDPMPHGADSAAAML